VYGQWILLVFISLHPLHTSVGSKFQTAQLQSDSKVSVVRVILVGTFNIVLLDLLCNFPEVNCDEPNNVHVCRRKENVLFYSFKNCALIEGIA
jgi:hypothetical protein